MARDLNSYLGCFKLRTGCFIIGYMGAISSFLCLCVSLIAIMMLFSTYKAMEQRYKEIYLIAFIVVLVVSGFFFALYATLLVGVYQKRPKVLNVYLVITALYIALTFVSSIVLTIYQFGLGLRCLLSSIMSIYNFLVVRSYYTTLKEEMECDTKAVEKSVI